MSRSRSSTSEPIFTGARGSDVDCDEVIRYVRKQALAEGRSGDDGWMTQLMASCLSKTALRWYEGLEEDTQSNWKLLRKAMLLRWPDDEDEEGYSVPASSAPPTPASAAPGTSSRSSSFGFAPAAPAAAAAPPPPPPKPTIGTNGGTQTGIIRVILEDSESHFGWVQDTPDKDGDYIVRDDKQRALKVSFVSRAAPHGLRILGTTNANEWLGAIWSGSDGLAQDLLKFGTRWATPVSTQILQAANGVHYGALTRHSTHTGPTPVNIWNVLVDGTMTLTWRDPDNDPYQYALHAEVIVSAHERGGLVFANSTGRQSITNVFNSYLSSSGYDVRKCRLIFEPL